MALQTQTPSNLEVLILHLFVLTGICVLLNARGSLMQFIHPYMPPGHANKVELCFYPVFRSV